VHGRLAIKLGARLDEHVTRLGLGTVLVEAGYVLQRGPDTVRGPDVSFVSTARLPPDRIPEEFISGPPDLAVEILSPGDRWAEIEGKVADYLAGGARLVWLVDPRERRVTVRYPDRPPRALTDRDILDGEDVVPGFALDLAGLFDAASRYATRSRIFQLRLVLARVSILAGVWFEIRRGLCRGRPDAVQLPLVAAGNTANPSRSATSRSRWSRVTSGSVLGSCSDATTAAASCRASAPRSGCTRRSRIA
jgi:Uma2 family endonuclease